MANRFIKKCRRVLQSLISETVIFMSGVQLAEAHPEAAISLASLCLNLVSEAVEHLRSYQEKDEYLERACEELRITKDLLESVIWENRLQPLLGDLFLKEPRIGKF